MLIRPFDYEDPRIAIIKKDGWEFDIMVAPATEEDKAWEVIEFTMPLTEPAECRTATIIINESYLIRKTKEIISDTKTFDSMLEESENYTFGPEEATAEQMYRAKRRAVSIVLEEMLDYVESYIFSEEYDD